MHVVLITGISGSGKTVATRILEDDGYFCIDNLPSCLLAGAIASLRDSGHTRVAVSVDARSGDSVSDLRQVLTALAQQGHDVKVLFLNARTDTLVQRYSETRRRHPLSLRKRADRETPTLTEAIQLERELMSPLESLGLTLDTSDMHPNALRAWVRDVAGADRASMTIVFESFAYKHGVPLDADLVFDVRCLPNPYYTPALRPLTGRDAEVAGFLQSIPSVQQMIGDIAAFLKTWLPHYILENRSYLTIAIGCTGGQHRSVYCVEELARRFRSFEQVLVRHRSLPAAARPGPGGE